MDGTLEPVAVLGIGAMGHGMARCALRAGIPTIVWNRSTGPSRDLEQDGAEVAASAADAARRAGIVVTMVTDGDAVGSIARDQGMLRALQPGAIWAQMSTIGVAATDKLADLVRTERPDVTFLDAPVSGSREPAERGELTIFFSGPQEARQRVTPLFNAVGQRTMWVGPVGAGSRLKVVNNVLLAFGSEAIVTSMAVGRRLGLPTETVVNAFSGGPMLSTWQEAKLQRVAKGDYSAQFSLSNALKDVRLALQVSNDDQFVALAGLAEEWQRALARGFGDDDLTVVARMLEPQVTR
jgi:3-hydroxyisobutyrate dehydrogenase